jgi:hypothetical protein
MVNILAFLCRKRIVDLLDMTAFRRSILQFSGLEMETVFSETFVCTYKFLRR